MRPTVKPLLCWLNVPSFGVRSITYIYHKLSHEFKSNRSKILAKPTTITFKNNRWNKKHCTRFYYFCLIFCLIIIFQKTDIQTILKRHTSNWSVLAELWEIWLTSRFCLLLLFALSDKPFSFTFRSAFYVNKTETKTTIRIKTNLNIWH